jgi:hypothetical protein
MANGRIGANKFAGLFARTFVRAGWVRRGRVGAWHDAPTGLSHEVGANVVNFIHHIRPYVVQFCIFNFQFSITTLYTTPRFVRLRYQRHILVGLAGSDICAGFF